MFNRLAPRPLGMNVRLRFIRHSRKPRRYACFTTLPSGPAPSQRCSSPVSTSGDVHAHPPSVLYMPAKAGPRPARRHSPPLCCGEGRTSRSGRGSEPQVPSPQSLAASRAPPTAGLSRFLGALFSPVGSSGSLYSLFLPWGFAFFGCAVTLGCVNLMPFLNQPRASGAVSARGESLRFLTVALRGSGAGGGRPCAS